MKAAVWLKLKDGEWRPGAGAGRFVRVFADGPGFYEIPFIQSARQVDFEVIGHPAAGAVLEWEFHEVRHNRHHAGRIDPDHHGVRIENLTPGEYRLSVRPAGSGATMEFEPIGIGTVVAALGDSITEGYWGRKFSVPPTRLRADLFPAESVSRDGRNFPQFAPTAAQYAPGVTCFESWLSRLNDRLAEAWQSPVFIANEGWGGYTTRDYLRLMATDAQWQDRLRRLSPQVWLIHLGVNDERAHRPAAEFGADLRAMLRHLCADFGADPRRVFVARPCHDYWDRAPEFLSAYIREIDAIRMDFNLPEGPDFYAAYATQKERWYGADPVHPNVAGMEYMADLWGQAIVGSTPDAPGLISKQQESRKS